jgi:hypothetical protein
MLLKLKDISSNKVIFGLYIILASIIYLSFFLEKPSIPIIKISFIYISIILNIFFLLVSKLFIIKKYRLYVNVLILSFYQ